MVKRRFMTYATNLWLRSGLPTEKEILPGRRGFLFSTFRFPYPYFPISSDLPKKFVSVVFVFKIYFRAVIYRAKSLKKIGLLALFLSVTKEENIYKSYL